jgi:hypothetical protein
VLRADRVSDRVLSTTTAFRARYLERRSFTMIRKLKSGKYRLYSQKKDPKTGKRKNLGTFDTREQAERHEREVQYFKRAS